VRKPRLRPTGTVREALRKGTALLHGAPNPFVEAKVLLMTAAGLDEVELFASPDRALTPGQGQRFFRLVDRRLSGHPLAYITGKKEFWSLTFKIIPGVHIPRPETELIVELVLGSSGKPDETIVDIGTGSGNIAVALAKELPGARIVATDVSARALGLAKFNARWNGATNIALRRGSLFSPLDKLRLAGRCDVIVSNPPYVCARDWSALPPEVKDYEPRRALIGGATGLEFIGKLVRGAWVYLRPLGALLFEIGQGQSERALSLFDQRWIEAGTFPDLQGIPRVVKALKA
jgi:release factor glutamine methyltransferase